MLAACIDRRTRGTNALYGLISRIEMVQVSNNAVLDRQACYPRNDCHAYAFSHSLGRFSEARFKISVDGQVRRVCKRAEMPQYRHAFDRIVRLALRPREAGARRGKRLKPKMLEKACTTNVPWIRQNEAA